MSTSYIPAETKCRLWGKSAGRCQYRGCNSPLWIDDTTKAEFNTAYLAHIVADSPDGPRGDPVLSQTLRAELSNLMVLCDRHHRLIDIADVAGHDVERLTNMKLEHEARIERITAAAPARSSEVLLYTANVGEHAPAVDFDSARLSMLPDWYPANSRATRLGFANVALTDRTPAYWAAETSQLTTAYERDVRARLRDNSIRHLSVFAIAPQPLLVLLGSLIGDITPANVYQLHREPPTWDWPREADEQSLSIEYPPRIFPTPALVLSLSGHIVDSRVHAVFTEAVSIYRVTIPTPNNDYLKTRAQLREFRSTIRILLDNIKTEHGHGTLHVFPAAPVSACVELGRVLMPKADMTLRVYDENAHLGGFVHALDIPSSSKTI